VYHVVKSDFFICVKCGLSLEMDIVDYEAGLLNLELGQRQQRMLLMKA